MGKLIIEHEAVPVDEIWMYDGKSVHKLTNLAIPEEKPLKIGDWPWRS